MKRRIAVLMAVMVIVAGCAFSKVKKCVEGCWMKVPREGIVFLEDAPTAKLFVSVKIVNDDGIVYFFGVVGEKAVLAVIVDNNNDGTPDRTAFMVGLVRFGNKELPFMAISQVRPVPVDDDVRNDFAKALKHWNAGKGCFPTTEWKKRIEGPNKQVLDEV